MRSLFLLAVLLPLCFCSIKWNLKVQSEFEGSAIVLVPGVYTKINLEFQTNGDIDFQDTTTFTLALDDSTVVLLNGEVKVTPTENQVYSAYIGISCLSQVDGTTKNLKFKLISTVDGSSTVELPVVQVQISKAKTKIDLDLLMDEIPGSSYDLFKMAKDILNVDEIKILPKYQGEDKLLEFTEIVLKSFDKREEISKDNAFNHGVLFDFPFGTKKTFSELNKASLQFNLNLETEGLAQCFEFAKSNFELKFKNEGPVNVDASVKTAIVYNTDNGSPKFDLTNSIQINTVIPLAPVLLSCEVRVDSEFSSDFETLKSSNDEEGVFHYKTLIDTAGQVSFKLDGLSADTEYYTKCTVSNTNFVEDLRKKIAITIGNFDGADIIRQLLPSRDPNRVPQCLELKFGNYLQALAFEKLGTKYCRWVMGKGEPILARILGTVVCSIAESASVTNPVSTMCIAPSPLYNIHKFLTGKQVDKYNENLEELISDLKNAKAVFGKYGLEDLIDIQLTNRYYDSDPIDISKVSLTLKSFSATKSFDFKVVSTNPQPIQCYYNPIMTSDNLRFLALIQDYVILKPNKEETISSRILSLSSGLFSLNFRCFNLPKFLLRFEHTDSEVMYTYYYNSIFDFTKQEIPGNQPITINCDEGKNKLNPHCLKKKILFIVDSLKTEIPAIVSEIQAKAEKFTHLAKEAQKTVLDGIQKELNNALKAKDKLKALYEKAIEMAKYLTYTDCSVYVSGSTNDEEETVKAGAYIECRKFKKDYLKKVIDYVRDSFKCATLFDTLIAQSTSEMTIEERLKYILLLINEISNNPDAYEENVSKDLEEVVDCLQQRFEEYWPKVAEYLEKEKKYLKESVAAVKRDVENLILQTTSNLVNALHFDEIDGYIDKAKEQVKETGMMIYDRGLALQKKIIEFAKKLIEFGNGTYELGLNTALKVAVNNGVLTADADGELSVFDLEDKGIKIITNSNFMLRKHEAHAMQTLVFESPLFTVKANGEEELSQDALSTFVSITLYDKDGKEITVKDVADKFRPQILYLKSRYEQLKTCFYFNEETNELEEGGLDIDEDFLYEGQKYFRCLTEHLTSFTAGTEASGLKWYVVLLIILGIIIVLAGIAVAVIMMKKRKSSTGVSGDTINNNFGKDEALVNA